MEAAKTVLPKRRVSQKRCLWDDDPLVCTARKRLATARATHPGGSHTALEEALHLTYTQRQEEIIMDVAREVNQHHEAGRSQAVWKAIDRLTGRRNRPTTVAAADTMAERLAASQAHFQRLLNATPRTTTVQPLTNLPTATQASTEPISDEELHVACRKVKRGKAAGPDGIPPDILHLMPVSRLVLPIMNGIVACEHQPPEIWRKSIIVQIPKQGNNSALPENQRGLSLMCTNAKLFNGILLARILQQLEQVILPLHAGFRPGRNTCEQILSLRISIDAARSRKRSLVIVFVDFSKAFDCVDREALQTILSMYGLPDAMVAAIMSLYTNTSAHVRTSCGNSDSFGTSSGVLQGDTLAPYLFVVVMDYIIRRSMKDEDSYTVRRRMSRRHVAVKLSALAFADDIALLSDDSHAAQRQLERLEHVAAEVGLRINEKKTKIMRFGEDHEDICTSVGKILDDVDDFCYLGCLVKDNRSAFRRRRELAWVAARRLSVVWSCGVSDGAKVALFEACVQSVLLYSGETWTVVATLSEEINEGHRALLRYSLGIHYPQRISNKALYDLAKVPPATHLLRRKRLQLIGHALRRPESPLAILLHHKNHPTEPYRRGGASRHVYLQQYNDDLHAIGLNLNEAADAAQHRTQWAGRVTALK